MMVSPDSFGPTMSVSARKCTPARKTIVQVVKADKKERKVQYAGPLAVPPMARWVATHSLALVQDLTTESSISDHMARGVPVFLLLMPDEYAAHHSAQFLRNSRTPHVSLQALDFIDPDKLSMTVVLTAMNRFINEADGSQTAFLDGNQPDRLCAPMAAHVEARGGEVRVGAPHGPRATDQLDQGVQRRRGEVAGEPGRAGISQRLDELADLRVVQRLVVEPQHVLVALGLQAAAHGVRSAFREASL